MILLHRDAKTDLLNVERAEAFLNREPPRSAAVARAERDEDRAIAPLLHRERRAELRLQRVRALAAVRNDPLRDRIAAAGAADAASEIRQLNLDAASRRQIADAAEQMECERSECDTADVEKRAFVLAEAQPYTVHGHARRELDRAGARANGDHVENHTVRHRRARGRMDPACVGLERDRDVAVDELYRFIERKPQTDRFLAAAEIVGREPYNEPVDVH